MKSNNLKFEYLVNIFNVTSYLKFDKEDNRVIHKVLQIKDEIVH
jgi:hypothetical protein